MTRRIISRASDTTKAGNSIRTWGEMTDAEKGALLLAAHEGKVIEYYSETYANEGWTEAERPSFSINQVAYRVRPEPVRETVTITGFSDSDGDWIFAPGASEDYDTHRITFDTLDGEPVTDSIRMEKL